MNSHLDEKNKNDKSVRIGASVKEDNSRSLITRASQIMAIIIGLGLVSMITSMLVSESLSGDAEKINRAGELRMLAVKISRESNNNSTSSQVSAKQLAIEHFNKAFEHLFDGGLTNELKDPKIYSQYQKIKTIWQSIQSNIIEVNYLVYDNFVVEIDQLVLLIQRSSESKISILRAIHGVSLLSVIIIAFIVLTRINRTIISPLKKLVLVANAAGKGDFSLRSEYNEENELGLLSQTINKMAEELKQTHDEFEGRVENKTKALSQSNRTLELLYDASKRLSEDDTLKSEIHILNELSDLLGFGQLTIESSTNSFDSLVLDITNKNNISHNICFDQLRVPIDKQSVKYGYLVWNYRTEHIVQNWQVVLIETIAEMFASARSHAQERVAENRLVIIEERAVIARELHDSLAQSLSYLKIQVALLTKKMDKELSREQIDSTVEDIHLGLNRAYLQLRELLTTFRLKLDDPSLKNALSGTVVEFSTKSNHPITLEYTIDDNSLTANQEIHVLQIVREALSNVQRHANASIANVSVALNNRWFTIVIEDDGVGMKKEHQLEGHFGLGIMQERSKSLNARLKIDTSLGSGTTITVAFMAA